MNDSPSLNTFVYFSVAGLHPSGIAALPPHVASPSPRTTPVPFKMRRTSIGGTTTSNSNDVSNSHLVGGSQPPIQSQNSQPYQHHPAVAAAVYQPQVHTFTVQFQGTSGSDGSSVNGGGSAVPTLLQRVSFVWSNFKIKETCLPSLWSYGELFSHCTKPRRIT